MKEIFNFGELAILYKRSLGFKSDELKFSKGKLTNALNKIEGVLVLKDAVTLV